MLCRYIIRMGFFSHIKLDKSVFFRELVTWHVISVSVKLSTFTKGAHSFTFWPIIFWVNGHKISAKPLKCGTKLVRINKVILRHLSRKWLQDWIWMSAGWMVCASATSFINALLPYSMRFRDKILIISQRM